LEIKFVVTKTALGCVIFTESELEQLSESVTVIIYLPAFNPVIPEVVLAGLVFHKKEYGLKPLVATAFAAPLLPPKQVTLEAVKFIKGVGFITTIVLAEVVHELYITV
jgi:hypothetical protein